MAMVGMRIASLGFIIGAHTQDSCPASGCVEDRDTDESYLLAKPLREVQHRVEEDVDTNSDLKPCATNFGDEDSCCGHSYASSKDAAEEYICPAASPLCIGYEPGVKFGSCESSTYDVIAKLAEEVYQLEEMLNMTLMTTDMEDESSIGTGTIVGNDVQTKNAEMAPKPLENESHNIPQHEQRNEHGRVESKEDHRQSTQHNQRREQLKKKRHQLEQHVRHHQGKIPHLDRSNLHHSSNEQHKQSKAHSGSHQEARRNSHDGKSGATKKTGDEHDITKSQDEKPRNPMIHKQYGHESWHDGRREFGRDTEHTHEKKHDGGKESVHETRRAQEIRHEEKKEMGHENGHSTEKRQHERKQVGHENGHNHQNWHDGSKDADRDNRRAGKEKNVRDQGEHVTKHANFHSKEHSHQDERHDQKHVDHEGRHANDHKHLSHEGQHVHDRKHLDSQTNRQWARNDVHQRDHEHHQQYMPNNLGHEKTHNSVGTEQIRKSIRDEKAGNSGYRSGKMDTSMTYSQLNLSTNRSSPSAYNNAENPVGNNAEIPVNDKREICASGLVLERHTSDENFGDVCRELAGEGFQCPKTCEMTADEESPYCSQIGTSLPCRATTQDTHDGGNEGTAVPKHVGDDHRGHDESRGQNKHSNDRQTMSRSHDGNHDNKYRTASGVHNQKRHDDKTAGVRNDAQHRLADDKHRKENHRDFHESSRVHQESTTRHATDAKIEEGERKKVYIYDHGAREINMSTDHHEPRRHELHSEMHSHRGSHDDIHKPHVMGSKHTHSEKTRHGDEDDHSKHGHESHEKK